MTAPKVLQYMKGMYTLYTTTTSVVIIFIGCKVEEGVAANRQIQLRSLLHVTCCLSIEG